MLENDYRIPNLDTAESCYADISAEIQRGVATSKHAFHLMTVGTVGLDSLPEIRTVVLRSFDPAMRRFTFHTDVRSPKVEELRRNSAVRLLLYDPFGRTQLRVSARGIVHHNDGQAREAWLRSQPMSRVCYATPAAPSAIIAADLGPPVALTLDENHEAYHNFAMIECRFDAIDVLVLASDGHRRMRLSWDGDALSMVRLAP